MTAAVVNASYIQALDELSQPISQASSPASPSASLQLQQLQASLPAMNYQLPATPTAHLLSSISLDPPLGMSYTEFLRTWSDHHVARWLSDIKCGQHAHTFRANDIRGDVLLELDQMTLKEMGMVSVGDRIRIIAGVKNLRQRCSVSNSTPLASIVNRPRLDYDTNASSDSAYASQSKAIASKRLDSGRPAPLHITPGLGSNDLPRLVRDGPDSARSNGLPTIRPQPPVPIASQLNAQNPPHPPSRGTLPPPPRSLPPQPPNARTPRSLVPPTLLPGRRTPTLPDPPAPPSNQSLPAPPLPSTQSANWPPPPYESRQGSGSGRTPICSTSPLPTPPVRNLPPPQPSSGPAHGRNASHSGVSPGRRSESPSKLPPRPATGNSPHPYAQPNLQPSLSPIHENLPPQLRANSGTPPPAYRPSNAHAARPNTPSHNPSLDDLRRKLIKFSLPDEGKSTTINAVDCAGGPEVLEKALRKFGKLVARGEDTSLHVEVINGGLVVEGWAAFLDWGQEDAIRSPLSGSQLLSIVHTPPNEPARDHGLTLRRLGRNGPRLPSQSPSPSASRLSTSDAEGDAIPPASQSPMTKAMKRASSISILSGLGVPVGDSTTSMLSPDRSPTRSPHWKGPSKLRNFFGQRPPSELITTHLSEYFPNTEKKVLERTRRQSVMRASNVSQLSKRDSVISWSGPTQSRFSVSTQGSHLGMSPRSSISSSLPPLPDRQPSPAPSSLTVDEEAAPRVSISTEDGRQIEVSTEDVGSPSQRHSSSQCLPPVNSPSEPLSESVSLGDQPAVARPLSIAGSIGSKRMSYIMELRSKRDKSDTASLMTVDEITAEVESRRVSTATHSVEPSRDSSPEEWTEIGRDEVDKDHRMEEGEDEEDEEEDEEEEEASDATVTDEEEDGQGKPITSHGERTIKWIKGALIGAGSFGKVYLGMDASTGLLMAVKQVELPTGSAPNEERKKAMLSALEREIELLRDLQHPNIVQYHSSCVEDSHLNIFLEYVPGGSVTSVLRNYGAFEEQLVRNWVRQILTGLSYLHERDIIHRDIKGANMLVDNKGGIKISDFGISKKVEDNLLPNNRAHRPSLQGSVFWMAPEVVKQTAYTKKADIWSIGCLVVEMLTGEHPWAQLTQMQAIFKIGSSAKPTIPPDISSEAEDFLHRTFELNHEIRPSASELLQHPWMVVS